MIISASVLNVLAISGTEARMAVEDIGPRIAEYERIITTIIFRVGENWLY